MNHPAGGSDTVGLFSLGACGLSTLCTFAQNVEPIINLAASAIAVVSGIIGGVYYLIKLWDRIKKGR